jgi:hypothetical protein
VSTHDGQRGLKRQRRRSVVHSGVAAGSAFDVGSFSQVDDDTGGDDDSDDSGHAGVW